MQKIYMYLLDTMSDWESGYLLQALTLQKMLPAQKYQFHTVARSRQPIKTAGGMTLIPDLLIDEIDVKETAALLLIGADTWLNHEQADILDMGAQLIAQGTLVAAICGATLGLANTGVLDTRIHTSNSQAFLTGMAPNYRGASNYRDVPAAADANLITAGSAGSLLWARYIVERLALFSSEAVDAWYRYFSTGDAKYFGELMTALQT